jgi:hypothetical protein
MLSPTSGTVGHPRELLLLCSSDCIDFTQA